jgi:dUTP pyrophosphatase
VYGRIAGRSGLALNHSLTVGAGVIDQDYRGNIGILLFNHSLTDYVIKKGDRVAQLILERIAIYAVEEVLELSQTERDSAGFGSTGLTSEKKEKKEL